MNTPSAILARNFRNGVFAIFVCVFWGAGEARAAWKNVCPAQSVCTNAGVGYSKFPGDVRYGVGKSFVLQSPRALKDGRVQVAYIASNQGPSGITVPTSNVVYVPSVGATEAIQCCAYYERQDGGRLYVDGAGAAAYDAAGRLLASTSFVEVLIFGSTGVAGPLTRVGGWRAFASLVYVGDGMVNTTTDDGISWLSRGMQLGRPRPGDSLYASPFSAALWVVGLPAAGIGTVSGSSGAIFSTADRGDTWTRVDDSVSMASRGAEILSLGFVAEPTALGGYAVYATTTKGLLVSRDKGSSWSDVPIPGNELLTTVAVVTSQTPNWIVVGTARRVIVSKDAGQTWTSLSLGLFEDMQHMFVVGNRLFAGNQVGWYECIDLACDGAASTVDAAADGVVAVVEFYHSGLDHYYLSANRAEAAWLDGGGAGGGWVRTGFAFRAWAPGGNPIGREVCRFYGNPVIGPNSHFFSMSADECEGLHQLQRTIPDGVARWNSEGLAFLGEGLDSATGQCRNGRVPVYRAYNNGAARGIDSNHRFVRAITEINKLTATGWSFEGTAFCGLQ